MIALQYVKTKMNHSIKTTFLYLKIFLILTANRFWKFFRYWHKEVPQLWIDFQFNQTKSIRISCCFPPSELFIWRESVAGTVTKHIVFLLTHFNSFCFSFMPFGFKLGSYHQIRSKKHMEMCFPSWPSKVES